MSSAENDTRLVPMTRAQRDWCESHYVQSSEQYPATWALMDAWDAAPADPAEALDPMLRLVLPEVLMPPDIRRSIAQKLLAALGAPKATP